MSIVHETNFKKDFSEFLQSVIRLNNVVTIATKDGNAVLLSEEEYRGIIETAYINSVPGLADKIVEAANAHSSEFVEVDWKNELPD